MYMYLHIESNEVHHKYKIGTSILVFTCPMYSAYRRLTLTRASVLGDHVATLTLTCKVPVCVDTAAILTETHLRQTFIDVYKTNQTQAVLSKVQTHTHTH